MRASLFTPWGHYYKLLSPVKSFLFIYHHFCSYKLWIIFSFQVFKEAFAYAAFSPFQSNHGVRCGSLCRWERSNDTQLWRKTGPRASGQGGLQVIRLWIDSLVSRYPLSALFRTHDLTDVDDWLVLLWLTGERQYAPPKQTAWLWMTVTRYGRYRLKSITIFGIHFALIWMNRSESRLKLSQKGN